VVSEDNGQDTPHQGEEKLSASLESFRADLDVFSGPLDLLLHLIRQDEVDVLEVSVSHITDQYLHILRALQLFDVNVAADFLVMAATLMDLKSRMLLPQALEEEGEEEEARDELVRQLLQYKRFREVSDRLQERAQERRLRFRRVPPPLKFEPPPVDLGDLLEGVSIWDLLSKYAEIVRQIEARWPAQIVYDEVSVKEYIEEVVERLGSDGGHVTFLRLFDEDRSRGRVIGIFLALLELVRQHRIVVEQAEDDRSQIAVTATPDRAGPDFEEALSDELNDAEPRADAGAEPSPPPD